MKTILSLLLCVAVRISAQTLTVGPQTFQSAHTNSSPDGSLVEYVPANETLKDWTKLFAVRQMRQERNPKAYIDRMGEEYSKKYPAMKYAAGGLEKSNRWFIDFISYPAKGQPKFVEWSFFRAETNNSGGLVVFQYAERKAFTGTAPEALRAWNLKELRSKMLPLLMTNAFAIR